MRYLIYCLTSPSGKKYVGQTSNLSRRLNAHRNATGCRALHDALGKYGFEAFKLDILKESLDKKEADYWENRFISEYSCLVPNGYNLKTGGTHSGYTKEARAKMSKSALTNSKNIERLRDIGKNKSPETCAKISESAFKRWADPEYKEKMIDIFSRRPKPSAETVEKRNSALRGKKRTPEQVAKMQEAQMRDETRLKRSASLKLAWAKRKAAQIHKDL